MAFFDPLSPRAVHPPARDSFGMTALEAGAWGAPTLLLAAGPAGVGAAAVLRPSHGEALLFEGDGDEGACRSDVDGGGGTEAGAGAGAGAEARWAGAAAAFVDAALHDRAALGGAGGRARAAALAHTEAAAARAVVGRLVGALQPQRDGGP